MEFNSNNLRKVPNPFKAFFRWVKGFTFSKLKNFFKLWYLVITVGILLIFWILIPILNANGISNVLLNIISFLTFARGGLGAGFFGVIGGIIGKMVVASALLGLINKGYKAFNRKTFRKIPEVFKFKNQINNLFWIIIGAGASLVLFNFFSGYVSYLDTMVLVAFILLGLFSLNGNYGLLNVMGSSITADKGIANDKAKNSLLVGFIFGSLIGFIFFVCWGFISYIVGGSLLIIGIALLLIFKFAVKKEDTKNEKE